MDGKSLTEKMFRVPNSGEYIALTEKSWDLMLSNKYTFEDAESILKKLAYSGSIIGSPNERVNLMHHTTIWSATLGLMGDKHYMTPHLKPYTGKDSIPYGSEISERQLMELPIGKNTRQRLMNISKIYESLNSHSRVVT